MPYTLTDSPADARIAQTTLDIPREQARQLGQSAVAWLEKGAYPAPDGAWVTIRAALEAAFSAKRSLPPEAPLPTPPTRAALPFKVEIANRSTLVAAKHLVGQGQRPLVLNLANGLHPGGGFLQGARAQEESLCRSSGLYHTLLGDPMYARHAARPLPDSTDWAILSPRVPVFRHDDGTTEPSPWLMDVLTCAAPVAQRVGQPESARLLGQRIRRALAIADAYGYTCLVLGAWGCGAFGNDADACAQDFHTALTTTHAGRFEQVVFAIADWSPERRLVRPFAKVFQGV